MRLCARRAARRRVLSDAPLTAPPLARSLVPSAPSPPPELYWSLADTSRIGLTCGAGGWAPPHRLLYAPGLQAVRCGGDGWRIAIGILAIADVAAAALVATLAAAAIAVSSPPPPSAAAAPSLRAARPRRRRRWCHCCSATVVTAVVAAASAHTADAAAHAAAAHAAATAAHAHARGPIGGGGRLGSCARIPARSCAVTAREREVVRAGGGGSTGCPLRPCTAGEYTRPARTQTRTRTRAAARSR